MMSLPDFREKQILFIHTAGTQMSTLRWKNENLVLENDGQIINQASCHKLLAVFIVGDAHITTNLIRESKELGVSLFLLKTNFSCYSALVSEAAGNYLLREKQYRTTSERELMIVKALVTNKIANQTILLKERNIPKKFDFSILESANNHKIILGIEGNFTKEFFKQYFTEIDWYRRLPRAKPDIINLLLDLGFTMLFNLTDALLAIFGFDNYKGVYHKLFFQRKSLACDIMEPLRCLVERQLLKSHNLKQINSKDFRVNKGVYSFANFEIQKKYLAIFSGALMERKEDIFEYIRAYYYFVLNDGENIPSFTL